MKRLPKKRFGRLFRLNDQRVNSLFSGKDYVIKNNVTESQAMTFMIKVSEAGCECSVQEMPDENEPEYDEKRKSGGTKITVPSTAPHRRNRSGPAFTNSPQKRSYIFYGPSKADKNDSLGIRVLFRHQRGYLIKFQGVSVSVSVI